MRCGTVRRAAFTLVELLVVIAIIAMLVALLLPAVNAAREAARRTSCSNNFKQIALGLHNYASARTAFPAGMEVYYSRACPEYPSGTFLGWGWGTRILPFIEEGNVYDQFDFKERSYVGVKSRVAGGARIDAFICPSDPNTSGWVDVSTGWNNGPAPTDDFRMSNIVGVADRHDFYCRDGVRAARVDGSGIFLNMRPVRFKQIKDGTSKTLMIGEITGAKSIHPTEGPAFLGYFWVTWGLQDTEQGINGPGSVPGGRNDTIDPLDGDGGNRHDEMYAEIGFSSFHPGGAHFAFADGGVQFITQDIDQALLESIATKAGGETLGSGR